MSSPDDVYKRRIELLDGWQGNPTGYREALRKYATSPIDWIGDWVETHDPRRAAEGLDPYFPLTPFPKQQECVKLVEQCVADRSSALIEKSRDTGITWIFCAYSVWRWLFYPRITIGWGSRKEMQVDRSDDPTSIFGKMRIILNRLPKEMLPKGYDATKNVKHMQITNPVNQSVILGEAGDNIGRGARCLLYFKDESAHYVRPIEIEAALGDTTPTQVDISSVSGPNTVFHRKRKSGSIWSGGPADPAKANVLIVDWSDHPGKTQEWYNTRRARDIGQGLGHVFAREVERDYTATLATTLIRQLWVDAAIQFSLPDEGDYVAGLDVADEGGDYNALCIRRGRELIHAEQWSEGDTGETARRSIETIRQACGSRPCTIIYDAVGVGAGIKAEFNRLGNVTAVAFKGNARAANPEAPIVPGDRSTATNRAFFENLKAQAWWNVARCLERTYRHVHHGDEYEDEEMLAISVSDVAVLSQLGAELCQAVIDTGKQKTSINKSPARQKSPNLADAMTMCYAPMIAKSYIDRLKGAGF